MLDSRFEFNDGIGNVVKALINLPDPLRPVYFSSDEKLGSERDKIVDEGRFEKFSLKHPSGFFLLGPNINCSIRVAMNRPLICDFSLVADLDGAIQFVRSLSAAQPIFGFVCDASERQRRNRFTARLGINSVESWVGLDTQQYVPGFYWLTLLPDALAAKHGVSIATVQAVAQDCIRLDCGQSLFRFYNRPEEWRETSTVADLCSSLPGVFDIEKIKPKLLAAESPMDLVTIARNWK